MDPEIQAYSLNDGLYLKAHNIVWRGTKLHQLSRVLLIMNGVLSFINAILSLSDSSLEIPISLRFIIGFINFIVAFIDWRYKYEDYKHLKDLYEDYDAFRFEADNTKSATTIRGGSVKRSKEMSIIITDFIRRKGLIEEKERRIIV